MKSQRTSSWFTVAASIWAHSGCSIEAAWTSHPRKLHVFHKQQRHPGIHHVIRSRKDTNKSRGDNIAASQMAIPNDDLGNIVAVPLLLVAALGLGFAAQGFINQMLEGDQGLAAFLRDGSGYNKSGLKPSLFSGKKAPRQDPLPWLKLPQLDFVEVAGQPRQRPVTSNVPDENAVFEKLESLRLQIVRAVEEGNVKQAESITQELEGIMKANNMEYKDID
jgi:hypothetical protein